MKRLLAIVVLGACATTPAPATPIAKPPTSAPVVARPTGESAALTGAIKKLRVTGPQSAQVERLLAAAIDKPVGSDELRGGLASSARLAGIADLTVRGVQLADGIELVVEVTGHPRLMKLVAREASGKVISLGINAPLDGPLDPPRVQALAERLRERYVLDGYFDADATWKQAPVTGGVEVTIEVVPGAISAIDGVAFTGNIVPKRELDALVAKWLVVGQPAVEARIASAVEAITAYYWDKGYANVRVNGPKPAAGRVTLTFEINEGPVFKLGAVELAGIPAAERPAYLKVLGVKAGDLFSRTAIANGRQKLEAALTAAGKRDVMIVPLTKIDLANRRIGLTLEISFAP